MKSNKIYTWLLVALLPLCFLCSLQGQGTDPMCNPVIANGNSSDVVPFDATFIVYGANMNMIGDKVGANATIGQLVVGQSRQITSPKRIMEYGYWSELLVPPFPPMVTATQGELLDRIQVQWNVTTLGASPTGGFKLYRDGIFLASFDSDTRNFNDFNVIAGRPYKYQVRGRNTFGDGPAGEAIGFQVPNGTVTGWVQTLNGNPVPDALVALMPMQGFSAAFGAMGGAYAKADTNNNLAAPVRSFLPEAGEDWSMTFWMKTEAVTAPAGLLQLQPEQLDIQAHDSAGKEGVSVSGPGLSLEATFPDSSKNDWHHIAFTFDGNVTPGQGRLYIDGVLTDLAPMITMSVSDSLNVGSFTGDDGWAGKLDELRIYHRCLGELDLGEVKKGTGSSLTPGLAYYWKMDEELGTKSFDVLQRNKLYFCGADFDPDRPPVRTSGITDKDGYYRIESASYGTGVTFLAEAFKNFYMHRSLEFVRSEQDTALLPDFPLPPKATLELWVNNARPVETQCLLSKKWPGNDFRLLLVQDPPTTGTDNKIIFELNGTQHDFGNLGMNYQHLAFTIDSSGSDRTVTAYKNGTLIGAHTFNGISGDWSGNPAPTPWVVGARESGGTYTDFYDGLIDEIAVYDSTLAQSTIQTHANTSRDMQERRLLVYFPMDEGTGSFLNNAGARLLDPGMTFGTSWTPLSPNQSTMPHEFAPGSRQVTLNPSVTSVDQVDFVDQSLVTVTGFVRYKGTDCFAADVEILVNNESYSPQIMTDSTGKFVADFEPGGTYILTPVLEDHEFEPVNRTLFNLVNPVAGLLFNDLTQRKISGKIAGGLCGAPIILDATTDCRIEVRTEDGCYIREKIISDPTGMYVFDSLPPTALTVAITKHKNLTIYNDFQNQGGRTIDLTEKDSSDVDFIYIAPPEVGVEGFDDYIPNVACLNPDGDPLVVLAQFDNLTLKITVYEQYGFNQDPGARCPLDTAALTIENTFDVDYDFINPLQDSLQGDPLDPTNFPSEYEYKFMVDNPNPNPPYLKLMQVTANVDGRSGTFSKKVLVTGMIKGDAKFTTQLPMMPYMILRDPPGDGSYAYIEKGETMCRTLTFEEGGGGGFYLESETAAGSALDVRIPFIGTKITGLAQYGNYQNLNATVIVTGEKSMEVCLTTEERISTDDSDLIVGGQTSFDGGATILAGNDVYVGTGINLIISESLKLSYDAGLCEAGLENTTTAAPDRIMTTYMYSEWNIENNVIRYLDSLLLSPGTTQLEKDTAMMSKERWEEFIAFNKRLKMDAVDDEHNISWDAGVEYEYSTTYDTTKHWSATVKEEINSIFAQLLLINVEAVGAGTQGTSKIGASLEASFTQGVENDTTRSWKIGYALKDDDPGDTWTMDVKTDPCFRTPVFKIRAGQTSCPWEVGTARREGVSLDPVSDLTQLDIPSNGIAAFEFLLSNNSQTGETFTYSLTAGPESNTKGAIVKLNGAPLDHNVYYAIPWGEDPIPVTITVERGPTAYKYFNTDVPPDHPDYDPGLEIVLFSECHDIRSNALGFAPDFDPILYSAKYLKVEFTEPCSEVDIAFPFDGWVIKPDMLNPLTEDNLDITVYDYDLKDDDFEGIRLQYRPSNGNGAWFNITDTNPPLNYIPKSMLDPVSTSYEWNTAGLADGPYEIRAQTVCSGGPTDNPGFSHVIKGKIDRLPPVLVGTPEPADGVLQVGDEISFTFNDEMDCDKLYQNPSAALGDKILLFDVTANKPIGITFGCFGNKIVLTPDAGFLNSNYENHIIRAELHGIEDLTGNVFEGTKQNKGIWEFYVDRNELAWLTDSIGMTKYEDNTQTVIAKIHNRGGYPVPFKIKDLPDWVRVVPDTGVIVANEIREIRFEVDSSLAFGHWTDSIILHTVSGLAPANVFKGGDERIPLGVRVICRPPNWELDAGIYPNTMNMVLKVDVQGAASTDIEDIVAAYIDDELRGRAHVQYLPQVDEYLAYLTIYGDSTDVLKPVRLEVWDASACLRYGEIQETYTFQPDVVIGFPSTPELIHTNSLVLREIPLAYGWNWVSFNLDFPDNSLDAALSSLSHPANDFIRSQGPFAVYSGTNWVGSLTNLGNTGMYVYKTDQPDTLKMLGNLIDPLTADIPVAAGWNWIGYIPNYALPINDALGSLVAQPGDLIKSQVAFAQYLNNTHGWVGNLLYMQPPRGYQIKLANAGTLSYPANFTGDQIESRGDKEQPISAYWTVDPTQYEFGSTLIGALEANGKNITTSTMELGAFVGNEVRGAAQAIYIPSIDAYQFFLTTYANTNGEQLHYKLYDSETGVVQDLAETMYFSADQHQGTIAEPVPFSLPLSSTAAARFVPAFDIQPNPFNTETTIRFTLPSAQDIALLVYDVNGSEVSSIRTQAAQGLNVLRWNGMSSSGQHLNPGVYFVRLLTEAGSVTRKVVLQR